ncbi:hypothetical protein CFP56_032812 [Quercus suber]|uniref:Uncharacterized protein n=1 Tax=Quercus suber TaxID=58331 RepID=A0AAW0JI01_QUESU
MPHFPTHLRHSLPNSLIEFLGDEDFTFVGVGIESDVEKLLDDYDLKVGNVVDLRGLAVDRWEQGFEERWVEGFGSSCAWTRGA